MAKDLKFLKKLVASYAIDNGKHQWWVATQIGINPGLLSRIMNGHEKATLGSKEKICSFFKKTPIEIFPELEKARK